MLILCSCIPQVSYNIDDAFGVDYQMFDDVRTKVSCGNGKLGSRSFASRSYSSVFGIPDPVYYVISLFWLNLL